MTASVFTVAFVGGTIWGWFALPIEIRSRFNVPQILTLLGILAVLELVMWLLAGSVVRAREAGLEIRNGARRRFLSWSEIASVRLRPGDPWAVVLRAGADPEDESSRVMLFGLQGSEGESARAAVQDLNREIQRRSRAPHQPKHTDDT